MAKVEDLTVLSTDKLVQDYVDNLLLAEATEHVGKHNRLIDYCWCIVDELRARTGGTLQPLRSILDHESPAVRGWAELALKIKERPKAAPIRYVDEVYWQSNNPPPIAMSLAEIKQRLTTAFPASIADQLIRLARPAIGLWPQRPKPDIPIHASRFGGMPYAPPGWEWPMVDTEPMLFLGHINCAEFHGLPEADKLPSGLLAFFGDHDDIIGGWPNGGAVYHWPDIDRLAPAEPSTEPAMAFPLCALASRTVIDLPDPMSKLVQATTLHDRQQLDRYREIRDSIRFHGVADEVRHFCALSKLFGWPDLVQIHDLEQADTNDPTGYRLLLQIDEYSNGQETEGFGPGGSLYFSIPAPDLSKHRFDRCDLEVQCT